MVQKRRGGTELKILNGREVGDYNNTGRGCKKKGNWEKDKAEKKKGENHDDDAEEDEHEEEEEEDKEGRIRIVYCPNI